MRGCTQVHVAIYPRIYCGYREIEPVNKRLSTGREDNPQGLFAATTARQLPFDSGVRIQLVGFELSFVTTDI